MRASFPDGSEFQMINNTFAASFRAPVRIRTSRSEEGSESVERWLAYFISWSESSAVSERHIFRP